jgi:hypothetical protein
VVPVPGARPAPARLGTLHFGQHSEGLVTSLVYPPDDLVLVVKIQRLGDLNLLIYNSLNQFPIAFPRRIFVIVDFRNSVTEWTHVANPPIPFFIDS